jgi:hypothetical protein
MTKFISIGVDCGFTYMLKKHNMRNFSLPFDWVISYRGVSEIIKNNFECYLPITCDNFESKDILNFIPKNNNNFNNMCDVWFIHDSFPKDLEKLTRRIERFKNLLNSNEKLVFLRKSHGQHHHNEYTIKNYIDDAEELDTILNNKYPNLKYIIVVVLICGHCFKSNIFYKSKSSNIKIYNISNIHPSNHYTTIPPQFEDISSKIFAEELN